MAKSQVCQDLGLPWAAEAAARRRALADVEAAVATGSASLVEFALAAARTPKGTLAGELRIVGTADLCAQARPAPERPFQEDRKRFGHDRKRSRTEHLGH